MARDDAQINDLIRDACVKMSAYLAAMLTRAHYDPSTVVQAGELISGWSISTSEQAELLLEDRLDLVTPHCDHRRTLAKSTAAFVDHFASGHYDDCFPEILESYLDFQEWNGEVPTRRGLFKPPKDHLDILDTLSKLGYLTISDHGYCWTDKVSQAMLCIGAWNTDVQSLQDIKDLENEISAREIASNLSSDLLVLARSNPDAAFGPILRSLEPEFWYNEGVDKLVVERVIEIVHSGTDLRSSALN